jgi:hypothetical protein
MGGVRKPSNSECCNHRQNPLESVSWEIASSCMDPVLDNMSVVKPRLDEQYSGNSVLVSDEMC